MVHVLKLNWKLEVSRLCPFTVVNYSFFTRHHCNNKNTAVSSSFQALRKMLVPLTGALPAIGAPGPDGGLLAGG